MIKVGLIGYGYWGINLLRNFNSLDQCNVEIVCDERRERLDLIARDYPHFKTSTLVDDIFNESEIRAVIIATPVATHYAFAKRALLAGKHVLVEKPMTTSYAEANELVTLAESKGLVLAVDHTFLFTGSVIKIKELVDKGEFGDLQYFDSTRINLGLFQSEVNVIWDLAPHDISILNHLIKERPKSVICTGQAHTNSNLENIAYLNLIYENNFIAHFNCSWVSPLKVRRILIGGSKKMCLYDDVEPTEKVKIYDSGYSVSDEDEKHKMFVDYRVGDIYTPKIAQNEALKAMAEDFINSIIENRAPLVDGKSGAEVVRILEAAQHSIENNGKEIFLSKNREKR